MRKAIVALAAFGLLAGTGLTACTDDDGDGADGGSTNQAAGGNGEGKIGVILPDTKTSQRWATDDPKFLKEAFDAAGVPVDIQNAEGDKARFQSIADGMINDGVKVLMIVNLDSPTGKAVLDKAKAAKIKTIDYDRLTLNGGAEYYVSFDNVEVGRLQGNGLVSCLAERGYENPTVAELNGSPTDNNATDFKAGYDEVLQLKYDAAEYTKGPDQSVPDWVNEEGGVIFDEMFKQRPDIKGVLAANDGLAGAVINVLKKAKKNGQIPVTGQDATVQGLQNILTGDQCMTVYKSIKQEAQVAADLAITLFKGEKPDPSKLGQQKDVESGAYIPSVLLKPVAINKSNVGDPIKDGFVDYKAVCKGAIVKLCDEAGIEAPQG
jgi:D-xylose transport system substrate-binding protein